MKKIFSYLLIAAVATAAIASIFYFMFIEEKEEAKPKPTTKKTTKPPPVKYADAEDVDFEEVPEEETTDHIQDGKDVEV